MTRLPTVSRRRKQNFAKQDPALWVGFFVLPVPMSSDCCGRNFRSPAAAVPSQIIHPACSIRCPLLVWITALVGGSPDFSFRRLFQPESPFPVHATHPRGCVMRHLWSFLALRLG